MKLHPARWRWLLAFPIALLAGCSKPQAPESTPGAPVKWEPASQAVPEEWAELVGVTQPLPDCVAHVSVPVEGRVVSLLKNAEGKTLHEGDVVAEGEVIARLDDHIAVLNRDKAEAALKAAGEEKTQAQTALTLASEKLVSLKALKEKTPSLVPDLDLKTAEGAEQDARSKVQGAAQRQEQAAKELETAKQLLQLYALTAPHKGRIGRVQASLGQSLAVGAEVAEVIDIEDEIDVLCFVSQHAAAKLQTDQPAGLGGFDPRPGEVQTADAPGRVAYVADKAESESGCFAVKVRFPNKQPRLRGNVVQRVRVQTKPGEAQLCIPEAALLEDQEQPSVVIVENVKTAKSDEGKDVQTGTAKRMRAKIGVRDRVLKQVAILGLEDSDGKKWEGDLEQALFVTKNGLGLQTDDPVRLQEEED
jgi:RND family efflux transporter MFP subunit